MSSSWLDSLGSCKPYAGTVCVKHDVGIDYLQPLHLPECTCHHFGTRMVKLLLHSQRKHHAWREMPKLKLELARVLQELIPLRRLQLKRDSTLVGPCQNGDNMLSTSHTYARKCPICLSTATV